MPTIFGTEISKDELRRRVGDMAQIAGVRRYELVEGNTKGVEAIDFWTGSGFQFTVLPGRAMDISRASFCGMSLNWCGSPGEVAASYYEPESVGWLRTSFGGLVKTCGLTNFGQPCVDKSIERSLPSTESLGLHGRISNTPARNVCADARWEGNEYVLSATGKVRQAMVFGENLVLTRRITAKMGESRFWIHDEVENEGYRPTPFQILYHCNPGYPVLDESSELIAPAVDVAPRGEWDKEGIEDFSKFHAPEYLYREKVYFINMAADAEGFVWSSLVNPKLRNGEGLGLYLKYKKAQLPYYVEWKQMGEGEYAVGMEPANSLGLGRDKERASGRLQFLQPGEKKEFYLEIGVLTGREEIQAFKKRIEAVVLANRKS